MAFFGKKNSENLVLFVHDTLNISDLKKHVSSKEYSYIDDLINNLMEFYVILKLFSTDKVSIIHMGLYHTTNISRLLMIDYQFNILYKNGVTDFTYASDNNVSCVKLPNNISKFGIQ